MITCKLSSSSRNICLNRIACGAKQCNCAGPLAVVVLKLGRDTISDCFRIIHDFSAVFILCFFMFRSISASQFISTSAIWSVQPWWWEILVTWCLSVVKRLRIQNWSIVYISFVVAGRLYFDSLMPLQLQVRVTQTRIQLLHLMRGGVTGVVKVPRKISADCSLYVFQS